MSNARLVIKLISILITQMELQSMQNGITVLGTVAHKAVVSLRNDLSSLRGWFYCHRSEITNTVQVLYSHIQEYQNQIQVLLQVCLFLR